MKIGQVLMDYFVLGMRRDDRKTYVRPQFYQPYVTIEWSGIPVESILLDGSQVTLLDKNGYTIQKFKDISFYIETNLDITDNDSLDERLVVFRKEIIDD